MKHSPVRLIFWTNQIGCLGNGEIEFEEFRGWWLLQSTREGNNAMKVFKCRLEEMVQTNNPATKGCTFACFVCHLHFLDFSKNLSLPPPPPAVTYATYSLPGRARPAGD